MKQYKTNRNGYLRKIRTFLGSLAASIALLSLMCSSCTAHGQTKLLGKKHIDGSFGPSSPVIMGGTLYVSNGFGWVNAIPLSQIQTGGQ
jgi:hypothetical protein